jgi:hypothetical protein
MPFYLLVLCLTACVIFCRFLISRGTEAGPAHLLIRVNSIRVSFWRHRRALPFDDSHMPGPVSQSTPKSCEARCGATSEAGLTATSRGRVQALITSTAPDIIGSTVKCVDDHLVVPHFAIVGLKDGTRLGLYHCLIDVIAANALIASRESQRVMTCSSVVSACSRRNRYLHSEPRLVKNRGRIIVEAVASLTS